MSHEISYGTSAVGARLILTIGMRALGSGSTLKSVSVRITCPRSSTSSADERTSLLSTQHRSMSVSSNAPELRIAKPFAMLPNASSRASPLT